MVIRARAFCWLDFEEAEQFDLNRPRRMSKLTDTTQIQDF